MEVKNMYRPADSVASFVDLDLLACVRENFHPEPSQICESAAVVEARLLGDSSSIRNTNKEFSRLSRVERNAPS